MYKCGDKLVFKIEGMDANRLNEEDSAIIMNKQLLGKLSDFTKPKKIRLSEAEKKEFDWLADRVDTPYDIFDILNDIKKDSACSLPNLHNRLFKNYTVSDDAKNQFEFVRALENPELIEVEKPKKYYVHLFPGECGYLNKLRNNGNYTINDKNDMDNWQAKFTKEEIAQIPQGTFKITDKALEEVEEDE